MTDSITQRDLAELLGISTRQVRNLEAKGLPHHSEDGKKRYSAASVQWFVRHREEFAASNATPGALDKARTRKAEADAELAELNLAVQRGRLLERPFVEAEFEDVLARLRSRLVNMPARYGGDVVGLKDDEAGERQLEIVRDELLTALHSIFEPGRSAERAA